MINPKEGFLRQFLGLSNLFSLLAHCCCILTSFMQSSLAFAETPPEGLGELLERSKRTLESEAANVRQRLAEASGDGEGLDDRAMQRLAEKVHALLWRYYFDPRTDMLYTILEPHTGQVIFPSQEEVRQGIPNDNGWSTSIEDCAGYGNGKHLAWLVERYEVTHKQEHAEQARRLLAGALLLGEIRPADSSGFAELVRGVLPDGQTYYKGKGHGSSGDQYNGYSYALWRYARSSLATDEERSRIAAVLDRTCYRNGAPAFVAIASDVTGKDEWASQYGTKREEAARSYAAWTVSSRVDAQSWTAVQLQIRLEALRNIEKDPVIRSSFDHAMKANAWSRCKDIMDGLSYDESKDEYWHRVSTVRNTLDGLLTVMLTGDTDIITSYLPLFRRVMAHYDVADFRDQRQLTPFLGAYWLAVRCGALKYDPGLPPLPGEAARLNPLDPNRNLVLTYFANCNPQAWEVVWDGQELPGPPNWRLELERGRFDLDGGKCSLEVQEGGRISSGIISAPWVRDVDSKRGYKITLRLRIVSGAVLASFCDGVYRDCLRVSSREVALGGKTVTVSPDQWHIYSLHVQDGRGTLSIDGKQAAIISLTEQSGEKSFEWEIVPTNGCGMVECSLVRVVTGSQFRFPRTD